ncbi:MAG: transcription-repair coupling factor [Spirochaetaceae bacterium]|jgi:transcription-repair coupling factor (superfamily II helicase)|nr:transcription-repair coupling factor [Spirochaetaceae bacterium]
MISLFLKELKDRLSSSRSYKAVLQAFQNQQYPIHISGSRGLHYAAMVADLNRYSRGPSLIITASDQEAQELLQDLSLFSEHVFTFPSWGSMLYRGVSPQSSLFGKRVQALSRLLLQDQQAIVICSLRAAKELLPPPEYLKNRSFTLQKGQPLDPQKMEEKLVSYGYFRVPRVTVAGEFALRGEILDIYPPGQPQALRILFEFDELEEIRLFDPIDQTSGDPQTKVQVLPVREVHWEEEELLRLRTAMEAQNILDEQLLENLETQGEARGEELFYPMAFEDVHTIMDYLGDHSTLFLYNMELLKNSDEGLDREFEQLYQRSLQEGMLYPAPNKILTNLETLLEKNQRRVYHHGLIEEKGHDDIHSFLCEPPRSYFGNLNYFKEELENLLALKYRIYLFAESQSQADRMSYILKDYDLTIISQSISGGLVLPESHFMIIQENEVFGRKKRVAPSVTKVKSQVIDSFVDLNPGDLVVHVNYGIGRFKGINRISAAGSERDYITVEYAGEETVFIPIEQVNLIQRFIGSEGRQPRLDTLGGPSWEKRKGKVKKKVEDIADRLIHLYARRQEAVGYAFPKDNDFQIEFEAAFPYQETRDQLQSIAEIKADMERPRPMDRLLCGDVGYGKTEVAMRAAFKAIMGGRQVALVCPTTILAEQHYDNFVDRFRRFPIKIAMMSRLVTTAEQRIIKKGMENGEVDLLLGTHRVLSKDIKFKRLGLVIIDEEQRFGVKHKERLKEVKHDVDSLTLSATPIPRTLHMSMVKIRDLSMLKTAPSNRKPVETFIQAFEADTVTRAIRRETERGGQVFFLHNRVESLPRTMVYLRELMPEIMIEMAHGQMPPRDLEDIMHRFVHGGFQVLVSTTIIESGIDIPNVNTIVIDRADMYGVSQLYQLRGRVGRSNRLAYAYLLYPQDKALTELAMKRLKIINDFTELGSGFKIAMKDMEVRGAGNLLGSEQSGEILAVGFDMYLKLLSEAVENRQKKEDQKEEAPEVYLELDYSGYVPDSYVTDASEKMEIYKKIAAVELEEELNALQAEIYDRFGPMPDELQSLLSLAELRIICKKLWISSLKERKGLARITFARVAKISVDRVMRLITESGGAVKLNPASPDTLLMETNSIGLKEKSEFIRDRLTRLL